MPAETETRPKAYKLLIRWCSFCITSSPRKITEQGEPSETDAKFWKDHVRIESECAGCGNAVVDFYTPTEIKNMESVGILK